MTPLALAALLADERRRSRERLARLEPLRLSLADEVAGRSGPVDLAVPQRHGEWWVAARIPADGDRAIHARLPAVGARAAPSADEFWASAPEVLLDEARLGRRSTVGRLVVAAAAPVVAMTIDRRGSERFDLLVDGRLRHRGVSSDVVLSPDGRTILAVELARDGRPATAVALGRPRGRREVAVEPDPARWLEVSRADGLVVLASRSLDGDRVSLVHADGTVEPVPVGGSDARLLPLPDGRVLVLADGRLSEWRSGAPARPLALDLPPGATIHDAAIADRFAVLDLRVDGDRLLGRLDPVARALDGAAPAPPLPVALHRPAGPGESLDLLGGDGAIVRGAVSSLVLPPSPWELDARSGRLSRSPAAPGAARQWVTRARSVDGVGIPVTIAASAGAPSGPRPLVLLVYGAYGVPFEPRYSPGTASLLDRGAVLAIAHVRGGGELGPAWHDAARGLRKHVSVDDFLAVAEHLVAEGWTERGRIVAQGSSAGATVVGAALNRDPGLFAGAVVAAPFVDPLSALLDRASPLAAVDVPEWGDPHTEAGWRALRAVSPLHGVVPGMPYPPVLVSAGVHDPRAPVRDVARWVGALRESGCDATLLLDPGGHAGPPSRRAERERFAGELAWMLDVLGLA